MRVDILQFLFVLFESGSRISGSYRNFFIGMQKTNPILMAATTFELLKPGTVSGGAKRSLKTIFFKGSRYVYFLRVWTCENR